MLALAPMPAVTLRASKRRKSLAPLPKSVTAGMTLFSLHAEISELEKAYEASVAAVVERRRDAEATVRSGWGLFADQDPPEPEYFEDIGYTRNFWEEVQSLEEEMDAAILHVRSAFLIVLFHTFEKWLKRVSGIQSNYREQTARVFFSKRNISLNFQKLALLKDAADLAKHESKPQAERLLRFDPDLVDRKGRLCLRTDEKLHWFFSVLREMRFVGRDS